MFVVRESTQTESMDEIGKDVDFAITEMDPLVDKSRILERSTEKTRVGCKTGNCEYLKSQPFLFFFIQRKKERKKEKKKDNQIG